MAAPLIRKKKKNPSRSRLRRNWWLAPVLLGVGLIVWVATGPRWSRPHIDAPTGKLVTGFVASTAAMREEYAHFYGTPLNDAGTERAFEQAGRLARAEDYSNAARLLEQVSNVAAVPVVFNNLGVLYAELKDAPGATIAFREALARDVSYAPVRSNLARLKDVVALDDTPVLREVEPNNEAAQANSIAVGKAVEAAIDGTFDDVDYFRFTTPPAPRDLISIEIASRSSTLKPALKVFIGERRITEWSKIAWEAGSSLRQTIAPPPNATLYLEVSGNGGSAGAYTLLVKPLKAYDAYEPNDDIRNARRIKVGASVAAGIMDADDTDYYSFVGPRTGTVAILVANRSAALIPGLSTFNPDMRPSGSAPEVRNPGANLRHTMEVRKDQVYFVEVWPRAKTAGDYSLTVE